jgi:DNA-binding response OmpR family regulator
MVRMAKVLLVDDDVMFAESIREWLTFEHHKIDVVHTGADAIRFIDGFEYDVLLLDWQLPDMTGIDICKRYRSKEGTAYIIMLTGMTKVDNKVEGLESGADDYLPKPVDVKELSSRIRALMRRPSKFTGNVLNAGEIQLDTRSRVVTKSGANIQLKPLEYSVLEFFMRNPNQVIAPEMLLKRVWDSAVEASTDSVYTCINRLRKKLDPNDKEAVIKTVHGVGYRLDA